MNNQGLMNTKQSIELNAIGHGLIAINIVTPDECEKDGKLRRWWFVADGKVIERSGMCDEEAICFLSNIRPAGQSINLKVVK